MERLPIGWLTRQSKSESCSKAEDPVWKRKLSVICDLSGTVRLDSPHLVSGAGLEFSSGQMEGREDSSPMQAFDKDVLDLTVEDVYDISYVIGRDLLKVNTGGREFSDLQFKIVRVLEMFENMVNKYNLSMEELRMELDNMKTEMDRVAEGSDNQSIGPNKLVVDLKDPNRPRFTMQELKEVLQERNKLKAQLMVAQEELQLYKSGVLGSEQRMVEVKLDTLPQSEPAPSSGIEENREKSTIQKLFSFRQK
ncbi:RILP-like protein 2 [Anabarilius grahami]|uniref:RILP-like protein 2 n=1 Tax=Anabarilius grahami TaxID=495550 RepID=A0A3N0XY35_ANAGA|nr:RILP-like protein 2 [Anabarilius grahami]